MIYSFSAVIAEALSMIIYYPYEIVKVRMVAKNDQYNYKSIPDAFSKIYTKDGFYGMYKGSFSFLINYVMTLSI